MPLSGPMSASLPCWWQLSLGSIRFTVGTWEVVTESFPFCSVFAHGLAAPVDTGMMFYTDPWPHLPREGHLLLLVSSDGMNSVHESCMSLARGAKQLLVEEAFPTILWIVILLMVYTHYKHWSISRMDRDDNPHGSGFSGLLRGGEDINRLHNIRTPHQHRTIWYWWGLLEDADGLPIDDKLPVFSLDCAVNLAMGRVILEHVNRVVEVSEGNIIHLGSLEGSPGN